VQGGGTLSPARAIALGGLTVGTLDALDAIIFFGLVRGRPIGGIFQGIASGLIGPSAVGGGWAPIVLGLLIHFVIATTIVAVFCLASRRLPLLVSRPVLFGILYGVVAYLVMSRVVVPLTFGSSALPPLPVLVNGLLIHMFGVGLPSALFARAIDWQGFRSQGSGIRD
jgi:hypothetical protein